MNKCDITGGHRRKMLKRINKDFTQIECLKNVSFNVGKMSVLRRRIRKIRHLKKGSVASLNCYQARVILTLPEVGAIHFRSR